MGKIVFNKQQQEAVDFKDGACSVVASPGSGKTSLLLGRVEKLIKEHKIPERDILTITFTRSVADNLIKKLAEKGMRHVNVGTFHSVCGQILREEGIDINPSNMIQEWQIENVFKEIDDEVDTKAVLGFISYQKNYLIGADDEFTQNADVISGYSIPELRRFYRAYEDYKKKNGKYDFDDYLLLTYNLLKDNPFKTFRYILIDEHQDSNMVQNELLKLWTRNNNIFAVFDPKQALYSFRGGNIDFSVNFEKYWDDATTVTIDTNYRSTKNIVEKSNAFIGKYFKDYKHHKDSVAHNQENGHIEVKSYPSRDVEAKYVADSIESLIKNDKVEPKDIAVIYRNNSHADFVENELKRRKIDYEIANDGSFFKRREISGILSILRLIVDENDNSAFEGAFKLRAEPLKYFSNVLMNGIKSHARSEGKPYLDGLLSYSYPKSWQKMNAVKFFRYIESLRDLYDDGESVSDLISEIIKKFKLVSLINEKYSHKPEREDRLKSLEVLKSFAKHLELEEFINQVYSSNEVKKKKDNAVQMMTIHRSKGLEWDNVFLIGVEDGEFPSNRDGVDINEEARIFFVGVSRSIKNLWLSEIGEGNKFVKEYGYN